MFAENFNFRILPDNASYLLATAYDDGVVSLDAVTPRSRFIDTDRARRAWSYAVRVPMTTGLQLFGPVTGGIRTDSVMPLEELWGADAFKLKEQIHRSNPQSIPSLLLLALHRRAGESSSRILQAALAVAEAERERSTVAAMASAAGISERRLRVIWRLAFGMTPNRSLRIARFHRARHALLTEGERAAAVAVNAGYSDQAHMCREFLELAGDSPTAFLARTRKERARSEIFNTFA